MWTNQLTMDYVGVEVCQVEMDSKRINKVVKDGLLSMKNIKNIKSYFSFSGNLFIHRFSAFFKC